MENMTFDTIDNDIASNFCNKNSTTITTTKNVVEKEATTENIFRSRFINLDSFNDTIPFKPVVDVSTKDSVPRDKIFKVMRTERLGCNIEVPPTAAILMEKYWSRESMTTMIESGNEYRENRLK